MQVRIAHGKRLEVEFRDGLLRLVMQIPDLTVERGQTWMFSINHSNKEVKYVLEVQ